MWRFKNGNFGMGTLAWELGTGSRRRVSQGCKTHPASKRRQKTTKFKTPPPRRCKSHRKDVKHIRRQKYTKIFDNILENFLKNYPRKSPIPERIMRLAPRATSDANGVNVLEARMRRQPRNTIGISLFPFSLFPLF